MPPSRSAIAPTGCSVPATALTRGNANSAIAPRDHIAPIQPQVEINFWVIGAKRNWPNDPPPVISPDAVARSLGVKRCANAPIMTEKLPAPEPMAERIPIVTTSPKLLVKNGVSAVPTASRRTPPINTGVKPKRSAHAPAIGCATPHMNCPTAMAKLIATILTPVDPLIGKTNRPCAWRAPMVIISIAAAARVM